jgi:1-acyl-sn-glycerol-3-phosphate acyltransferase
MGSKLRSAYAWVLLSVIMLPLFPVARLVSLLTGRMDPRRDGLRVFTATWVSLYGRLTPLYRFQIAGRQRLPRGPHVLVANHESGLDVLCLLLLRTPARFLAETWMFRVPLSGRLFRRCRHIPVEPGNRESGRRALAAAAEALAEGTPVAMFPEGGMFPDGLGAFRPGAFVAAQRAGVPLVPVLLEGTGRAWRPGTMTVQGRHEIRISVLEPLSADEVKSAEPEALSSWVRAALLAARCAGAADFESEQEDQP